MKHPLSSALQTVLLTIAGFALIYMAHVRFEARTAEAATTPAAATSTIRVGYFATVAHAQALVGLGDGTFARHLGSDVSIEPFVLNAGPSAVEALFAGSIDLAYVGPNPAINAYVKSGGQVRVIAGACSGGAALVVRDGITVPGDLRGRRIATPQLGNTQDVAARSWLRANGLGDVEILPVANADQLTLFQRGEIDAVWAVEPWASRLIVEGRGHILVDERDLWPGGDFATALIMVRAEFLQTHRALVKRWLEAHVELTHRDLPRGIINREIARLSGRALPDAVLDGALSRLRRTVDPIRASLAECARRAFDEGFLGKQRPQLEGLHDLRLLNEVLREAKRDEIRD